MALSSPFTGPMSRPLSRPLGASGDKLLDEFTGAAAAYSLQSVRTQANQNVVRARRSIDDTEQDFNAAGVANGALRHFALNNDSDLIRFADGGGTNDRMYFDETDYIEVTGMTASGNYFGACTIEATFLIGNHQNGIRPFWGQDADIYSLQTSSGNLYINYADTGVSTPAIGSVVTIAVDYDASGNGVAMRIDGVEVWTGSLASAGFGAYSTSFYVGNYGFFGAPLGSQLMIGIIYDFSLSGSSVKNFAFTGYGVDAADWEDTVGSNDGTVVGSPALFSGQGFDAFVTNLYDQSGSLGQPLSRFAQHAGASDYRMQFDGADDYISVTGMTSAVDYFGACTIEATVMVEDASTLQKVCGLGTNAYSIGTEGGNWRLNGSTNTGVAASVGLQDIAVDFDSSGYATAMRINGSEVWTGSATSATLAGTSFYVGCVFLFGSPNSPFNGLIYDFSLSGSAVKNFAFNGYGITDADWEDTVGSNDGTVNGSPAIYQGRNALQATAASQPQIVADGVVVTDANGNATALFDGSNDTLTMTGLAVSESTAFTVVDFDTVVNDEGVYQIGTVNQVSSLFTEAGVLKARRQGGATDISATAPSSYTLYLFSHVAINDRAELWRNGSTQGANESDVTLATSSTGVIGGLDASTYRMAATLTELIIYGSDKTSDRAAIEANIADRYGITLA